MHLHNITSTPTLNGSTPHQALFGKVPNVSCLRVFGCQAIVHIPKKLQQSKFSETGRTSVLLSRTGSVYKVQDLTSKEMNMTKDVRFDETVFPCEQNADLEEYMELFERAYTVAINRAIEDEDISRTQNDNTQQKFALAVRSSLSIQDEPTLKQAMRSLSKLS